MLHHGYVSLRLNTTALSLFNIPLTCMHTVCDIEKHSSDDIHGNLMLDSFHTWGVASDALSHTATQLTLDCAMLNHHAHNMMKL